ncbi:chromosome partitioning protein ParA [Sulfolobales archaeon HS-7]|nr:chromosome partitioning protein ParA [Sulfolobales archaeon HS-7]
MIITVINQKGGVGKTTTSVNLAYVLSKSKKVGLLDLDPEGGSTISLGIRKAEQELPIGANFINIHGIDLFYAHVGLLNKEMNGEIDEVTKEIKSSENNHDVLIIDTPPNLGTLSVSAMLVADKVIAPVTPLFLSIEAVKNLGSRLQSLEKRAIAFTNASNKPIKVDLQSISFIDTYIPNSKIFQEAVRLGIPATKYEEVKSKKGKIWSSYDKLSKYIIE